MAMKLRVAILSPDPSDSSQGVERFCHSLKDSVAAHGIDAEVLARPNFDEHKFDVVVTNALVSVRTSIPRIHVYHGCHIPQIIRSHAEASVSWRLKFIVEAAFREVMAGIGANRVSVSNSCASEIRRWYRMESRVITNGIDTSTFRHLDKTESRSRLNMQDDERVALFIGRPEWRKRPDIALRAATDNGYVLYLAAGRPFDGMQWLGKLNQEQLATAIAAADVVLMPTQYEACSLALLEAISVGTPVVTSDAGWVPDLVKAVPEYSQLVSRVGDADAFSRSLANLGVTPPAGLERAASHVHANNSLRSFGSAWAEFIKSTLPIGHPLRVNGKTGIK